MSEHNCHCHHDKNHEHHCHHNHGADDLNCNRGSMVNICTVDADMEKMKNQIQRVLQIINGLKGR